MSENKAAKWKNNFSRYINLNLYSVVIKDEFIITLHSRRLFHFKRIIKERDEELTISLEIAANEARLI